MVKNGEKSVFLSFCASHWFWGGVLFEEILVSFLPLSAISFELIEFLGVINSQSLIVGGVQHTFPRVADRFEWLPGGEKWWKMVENECFSCASNWCWAGVLLVKSLVSFFSFSPIFPAH